MDTIGRFNEVGCMCIETSFISFCQCCPLVHSPDVCVVFRTFYKTIPVYQIDEY